MPFIANTDKDREEMLKTIGVKSVDDLFADIPAAHRFPKLNLPKPLSEPEVLKEVEAMAAKNLTANNSAWFLGAGAYDHFIPAIVPQMAGRGEFLTAYTPYEPEVSQGTLQAIFEYESMAGELLGVEVMNASHYDVATALAEAVIMAHRVGPSRPRVLIPAALHPEYKAVLATYLAPISSLKVEEYEGEPGKAKLGDDVACLVMAYPEFTGEIRDIGAGSENAHKAGALAIVQADPMMCAILKSPGELGADIVVAEGQSLGNPMNYGGPFLGMMGTSEKLMRRMPGRIVGEAFDHEGRKGYVLTLSAREQHIRREKAVSNICSNEGLTMLQTCIYLAAMGRQGMQAAAELCWNKAHYAASLIGKLPGYAVQNKNFFEEFTVKTPVAAEKIATKLSRKGIVPGFPVSRYDKKRPDDLIVCVTEMRSKDEIELLASSLKEAAK